jgi:hypothetical protein
MHGADPSAKLTPADDGFHEPTDDNPFWSETTWFSFTVPERRMQGYVYPWVRPNQGLLGGGVWIWDDTAHQPWEIPFWDNQYNLPYPERGDLRDIEFPNGISIRCTKPLSNYEIRYSHRDLELGFTFEALMEPHVLSRSEPLDRSWGPRVEDPDLRMAYSHGTTSDQNAFLAFAHPDADEAPVSMGYLLRDGEAAVLVEGTRRIERPGDWPTRVFIEATDSLGRHFEARGECVSRLSFTNIPWMFNWCSLTRWEYDGVEGWGEDQDVWHIDRWRRFIRERRARS